MLSPVSRQIISFWSYCRCHPPIWWWTLPFWWYWTSSSTWQYAI